MALPRTSTSFFQFRDAVPFNLSYWLFKYRLSIDRPLVRLDRAKIMEHKLIIDLVSIGCCWFCFVFSIVECCLRIFRPGFTSPTRRELNGSTILSNRFVCLGFSWCCETTTMTLGWNEIIPGSCRGLVFDFTAPGVTP